MPLTSPDIDDLLVRKYGPKNLEGKLANKLSLQEDVGWPEEPKQAIACLPAGMTDDLGGALLKELLPGLLSLPLQLVILGKGSASYGDLFTQLAKKSPHRIAILPSTEEAIHQMYAGSDLALFLSPCDKMQEVRQCMRYGTIPIGPTSKTLENYNPNQESGNAFTYEGENVWHCFAALVRALETYRFPFDWKTIQRHCMEARA